MREFVKILPLGLLLPLVIGAASVKPDDAISNIADWAHRFGFEGASRWLSNPAADNRVILGSLGVAAIYAFLVWTVPAIKERRANPQSERLETHLWTMLFYFMCTIFVVAIWRFVPAPPTPKPAPLATVAPAPPPPPEPWVSEEEFQAARKVGRLLIPFTPEEISSANYSRGSVATDAYAGRWVKINHPFASVRPLTEKDKKEYLIMTVTQSGWQAAWPAYLIFDSKKWAEQILILKRGTMVRALCQLTKYDKGANDESAPKFIGQNCELQ
jgi:hypothetical protein